MRYRLLAYLLLLVFMMIAGVIFLPSVFGLFHSGIGEIEKLFFGELNRLSGDTLRQYGAASVQAVKMSKHFTASIGSFMKKRGLSSTELKSHPELLEPLLRDQLLVLFINLYSADFSGAFITLDTTVNPNVRGAENSKAGLYIRNVEPNIGGTGSQTRYLLRGIPSLAGEGYINFQAKWELEFNVRGQPYWIEPFKAYFANPSLPLSRLLYWCSVSPVEELNESVTVCSVPVLDDAGRILGVCGFEISEMNFMLRHEPNISRFHNTVFLFSSLNDGEIQLTDALFSGNNAVYYALRSESKMSVTGNLGGLSVYCAPSGNTFVGIGKEIQIYPTDSPFTDACFAATIVVPAKDYDGLVSASHLRLILICLILLSAGIALSLFLSDRYEKSFLKLLEAMRSGDMSARRQIPEIDDLLEFMHFQLNETKDAENGTQKSSEDNESITEKPSEGLAEHLLDSFIANTKKLSRAEADVFNLYLEGCTAQEIASTLSLSINTIKTHNRRVFEKLNVSSRKELLTWVQVLTASGRSLDDSQQRQFDEIRNIVKNSGDVNE